MRSIGKRVEAWVRFLRPHLFPTFRNAYREMLARGMSGRRTGEPIACLDFSDPAIDAVGGRYYFSLVLDLIDAGYFPVFTANRSTLSTFGTGRVKSLLLGKRLGAVRSVEDILEPFLLITDSDVSSPHATRTIRVDYEWRLPKGADERAFPVFVHPRIAMTGGLPLAYDVKETRPVRLFFGGNTSEGKYDKDVIGEVYSMLSRRKMLDTVCAEIGETDTHRPADAEVWLDSGTAHPFVLCETQRTKIPPERWLEALGKSDFFLACPGVGMPLCHNLIEAMAAGSIPILQYGSYLPEPLEDGVNCIAFTSEQSLVRDISRVLAMPQDEVLALRGGVRCYWEENLAPARFARRLADHPGRNSTLLLNSYRVPR